LKKTRRVDWLSSPRIHDKGLVYVPAEAERFVVVQINHAPSQRKSCKFYRGGAWLGPGSRRVSVKGVCKGRGCTCRGRKNDEVVAAKGVEKLFLSREVWGERFSAGMLSKTNGGERDIRHSSERPRG